MTVSSLFITGGQVVAYVAGWLLSYTPHGWRLMVGLGAVPAIAQFLILLCLPETPRWLCMVNREGEARRVLLQVHGAGAESTVDQVLHAIENEIRVEEEAIDLRTPAHPKHRALVGLPVSRVGESASANTYQWSQRSSTAFWDLTTGGNRRALTIACTLQGLQQLCGFNSIMYFSATIFSLLSFSSPTLTSLSVAITNFIFTLMAFFLIDRIGRRRILLCSIPVMTMALLLCAAAFTTLRPGRSPSKADFSSAGRNMLGPIAILISIIIYVASYASGLGNVPWQQSELFPLSVRSLGSGFATATNWGCNFVVGLTFLPMMESLTPSWTFVTYAAVCASGWMVVWRIYPETMGLSLEEVGGLLKHGWGVKASMEKVGGRANSRQSNARLLTI